MLRRWFLLLCLVLVAPLHAQTLLVPAGSVWKYLDNGTNQGTAWRAPGFDDSAWKSGPAKLGYGDGDEATVVGYGPWSFNKYITTYFRRSFHVADAGALVSLPLRVRRDDGIVLYLNGVEVWRSNMPAGSPLHSTRASSAASDDGATWQIASLSKTALVTGTNVLAAEVHQSAANSADLSFDLELQGATTAALTRGPYLQLGTSSGIQVRWRTNADTDSVVRYGTSMSHLDNTANSATATSEHIVNLSGLAPDTRYYYIVGNSSTPLPPADASQYFVTAPAPGGSRSTRIWVIGDAGNGSTVQANVRNAYEAFTGSRHTDLWLQLGDNAYENGTDAEYQSRMFDVNRNLLRKSVSWPTRGNHDTASSTTPPTSLPYYNLFSFPTAGQAGGVASGSKNYYSFDFGNIHFICLDSMVSSRAPGSPMLAWLQADLATNTKAWTIAYWHHPPYSKGTHNSDTETQLIEMRTNVLPILESYGVDLVLAGHSHVYERSYLIDGHYGPSSTFTPAMKKDGGSGRPSETGAYRKPQGSLPRMGAVYSVVGSSGSTGSGQLNHPAMFVSMTTAGSMVLDIDGNTLSATFLSDTGVVRDSFSLVKGSSVNQPPSVAMTAPAAGSSHTAPASISLAATATDADGSIARVEFYNGATLLGSTTMAPYTFNWSAVPAGSYNLSARAVDNQGAATISAPVGVSVAAPPNRTPSVALTLPAAGSSYAAPATISLAATASDPDGSIARVEFYNGATLLGGTTVAPFTFNWLAVPAGSYNLSARAVDNQGAATTSTPVAVSVGAAPSATTLVAKSTAWKYFTSASGLAVGWAAPGFNDGTWLAGNALLGYGATDIVTVLPQGSWWRRNIAAYFRLAFQVADPSRYGSLKINLLRDDGAVVYLNGVELVRSNMPAGSVGPSTLASSAVSGDAERTYFSYVVPASLLLNGANVIAVEVHQSSTLSSDLRFDLELIGQP